MNIFYVFQNKTYNEEFKGGYVWSPQLTINGKKNAGYEIMKEIKEGDFIFHHYNGKLVSFSRAKTNCYPKNKPSELKKHDDWNNEGYCVDTEYYKLDEPLIITNYKDWLKNHYKEKSAFTIKGEPKQQYMCLFNEEQAVYFLENILELQKNKELKELITMLLEDISDEKNSEYNQIEKNKIEELLDVDKNRKIEWSGEKEEIKTTSTKKSGSQKLKRNLKTAANALVRADFLCEYNKNDPTFIRKNGKWYTEPHHLIPVSKYRDFEYSVDVMENIVPSCSNCHNLLHYGRFTDKEPILEKLYKDRKEALKKVGLEITLEQLKEYYK